MNNTTSFKEKNEYPRVFTDNFKPQKNKTSGKKSRRLIFPQAQCESIKKESELVILPFSTIEINRTEQALSSSQIESAIKDREGKAETQRYGSINLTQEFIKESHNNSHEHKTQLNRRKKMSYGGELNIVNSMCAEELGPQQSRGFQQATKKIQAIQKNGTLETGISGQNIEEQAKQSISSKEIYQCKICCKDQKASRRMELECGHEACEDCLVAWATQFLKQSRALRCPFTHCKELINLQNLQLKDKVPKNSYRNYKRHLFLLSLIGKQNEAICPNENCHQGTITIDPRFQQLKIEPVLNKWAIHNESMIENLGPRSTVCNKCGIEVCSRCLMPAHSTLTQCKSWKSQFLQIQNNYNYSQCQNCESIIEKSAGCNHMTCKCGYQFCFVCQKRWRIFHLCNPFSHSTHRKTKNNGIEIQPSCLDYLHFLGSFLGKILWTIFSVLYIIPLLFSAWILAQIGLLICFLVFGLTYGFGWVVWDACKRNQSCQVTILIIMFPYGMARGIAHVFRTYGGKFKWMLRQLVKGIDLSLPFNWVPYKWT